MNRFALILTSMEETEKEKAAAYQDITLIKLLLEKARLAIGSDWYKNVDITFSGHHVFL